MWIRVNGLYFKFLIIIFTFNYSNAERLRHGIENNQNQFNEKIRKCGYDVSLKKYLLYIYHLHLKRNTVCNAYHLDFIFQIFFDYFHRVAQNQKLIH